VNRVFDFGCEPVVLLFGLADNRRALSEIQIPVSVLDIADQISNPCFKIRQSDVSVCSGDQHAVVNAWCIVGPGDSIESCPSALEQWLANFGFKKLNPLKRFDGELLSS